MHARARSPHAQVQESALTGESAAVTKTTAAVREDAPLGDRTCLAFSGTFVARGSGIGIVVETGDRAEIGRVNAMMQTVAPPKAPLVQQLELLGRALAILAIVLAIATFFIAWQGERGSASWKFAGHHGALLPAGRAFAPVAAVRIAISIAVAVIPGGLDHL
jgi:magnesium-transporting ATPase (P-type)